MKYQENSSLWVEKYRPRSVDDCILPKKTKKMAQEFVKSGRIPNLILSGSPGTGKTTLARALCHELDFDVKFVNGSEEGRLLDTLRNQISNHARNVSLTGRHKVVIIDEADYIPADTVQPALRAFIEQESDNCSFIFTCNFPARIVDALHSRCSQIDFNIPSDERGKVANQLMKRIVSILKSEGVEYDIAALKEIVLMYFPDFRKILNELQRYSVVGKIDSGVLTQSLKSDIDELISKVAKKEWKNCRYWIAESSSLDMGQIVRQFYNQAYDHVKPESIPELVLILSKYQYQHAFAIDPEINIMSMLTEIMQDIEFIEEK